MFCPKCGANVSGAFCNVCGTPVAQAAPPPPPPPPGLQPPPPPYAAPPQAYSAPPPPPPGIAPPPPLQGFAPPPYPQQPAYAGGVVFDYAQWGTRALGYIVDMLIVGVVLIPVYFVLGAALAGLIATMANNSDVGSSIGSAGCCVVAIVLPLVSLLVGLYNSVYLVSTRGYSIGQGLMKIKTVNAQGQLLPMGTAFLRLLIRVLFQFIAVLSILDLLWPLWDERRQTLHDKVSNSYVINNPSGV